MADFNELFATLQVSIAALAKETLSDYVKQATSDGQAVLRQMKGDIEAWSKQLAAGDIDAIDLKFLIEGKKELTEMKALKQLGIAQIELDKFKSGMIDLILGSLSKLA